MVIGGVLGAIIDGSYTNIACRPYISELGHIPEE
jgi:hypothetical protein